MLESVRHEKLLNVPNVLTVLRLLMVPLLIVLFLNGFVMGALAVYIAAFLTDLLDGWIARRYDLITNFGKLMDPLADKLMLVATLLCFCLKGWTQLWILLVVGIKELYMIFFSTVLLSKNFVVSAKWIGKLATGVFLAAVVVTFFHERTAPWDHRLQLAGVVCAVCAMVWYTADSVRAYRQRKK